MYITDTCSLSMKLYSGCAVSEVLRFMASALHDVLRKAPSEALLLDNYARVCIVISEIINEVSPVILMACSCVLSRLQALV